jgi:hypothetical protein
MRLHLAWPARSWLPLVVISVLGGLIAAFLFAHYAFEDAYITLRYAQNLSAGRGYVFNPGEYVFGTSSPLWTLILGGLGALGANLEAAKAVASGVSLAALAFFGGLALQREGAPRAAALFALAVVFGFGRSFESWGMETPLFMALVFASLDLVRSSRLLSGGILMGLAVLTRHEGVLFALPMTIYVLMQSTQDGERSWQTRRATRYVLGLIVSTAPWWLFAYSTFGTIVPHTLEAKSAGFAPLAYLASVAKQFPGEWFWSERFSSVLGVRVGLCVLIGGFVVVGAAALWKRRSPMLAIAVGAVLILGGLSAIGAGTMFRWHRLPVHYAVLGVALLGASRALQSAVSQSFQLAKGGSSFILIFAACSLLGLPMVLLSYRTALMTSDAYQSRVVAYDGVIDMVRRAGVEHLTMLTAEPGYVAYHTDNVVIDAAGLVSPNISFGSDDRRSTTLRELLELRPDLILARAPFQPHDYRVLVDLDHRCRLLLRSDLWTESIERLASQ